MKKYNELSEPAKNSLGLYLHGNVSSIERLLDFQDEGVVSELREFTGAKSNEDLAVRLSIGAYPK